MGYTTDFEGHLTLSKNLTEEQKEYINKFADTRRMKRDVTKLMELYEGKFGHPTPKGNTPEDIYGNEGEYFVGGGGFMGQTADKSVLDFNTPPNQTSLNGKSFSKIWDENQRRITEGVCQPGLWCQWIIEDDDQQVKGHQLVWDGGEKFYGYTEWLEYLIYHFFERWGVKLNGNIRWQGEDTSDVGMIVVKNNNVETKELKFED